MKTELLIGLGALALGLAACATQEDAAADAAASTVVETEAVAEDGAVIEAAATETVVEGEVVAETEGAVDAVAAEAGEAGETIADAAVETAEALAEGDANADEGEIVEAAETVVEGEVAAEPAPQN